MSSLNGKSGVEGEKFILGDANQMFQTPDIKVNIKSTFL